MSELRRIAVVGASLAGLRAVEALRGPQDEVEGITFTGNGCSICMASASMMTAKMKRKTHAEAGQMIRHFQDMLTADPEPAPEKELGDLQALDPGRARVVVDASAARFRVVLVLPAVEAEGGAHGA